MIFLQISLDLSKESKLKGYKFGASKMTNEAAKVLATGLSNGA